MKLGEDFYSLRNTAKLHLAGNTACDKGKQAVNYGGGAQPITSTTSRKVSSMALNSLMTFQYHKRPGHHERLS
jgi:hypothetical protein